MAGQPARDRLAYKILEGFPADYGNQLLEDLGYSDNTPGSARTVKSELFLRQRLRELASVGPSFEEWIFRAFSDYRAEATEGSSSPYSHVHVQLIDDLDRCTEDYTADVLASLNFWSALPNLFFVVAADESHLQRSAQKATDLLERYPGEALEKFVHFQLRLPALISDYSDAARYCLRLMPEDGLSPGGTHLRSLLQRVPQTVPMGFWRQLSTRVVRGRRNGS